MKSYIEKTLFFVFTLFFLFTSVFLSLRFMPGDPLDFILSEESLPEEREMLRKELGLDLSIGEQYKKSLVGVLKGDLGNSLFRREGVINLIFDAMRPTLELGFLSVFCAFFIGITLGSLMALRSSPLLNLIPLIILSLPVFSIGPILVYIFSIKLHLLPISEWLSFKHKLLPILTVALPLGSILARVVKYRIEEELESEWVHFLRAKGLSPFSITLRLIKKVSTTISQIIGIQLSVTLAGTMVTETIFDIPGMGLLLIESIQIRDYPVIQGIIFYSAFIYLVIYFFVDFINLSLDPRLRIQR